MSAIFKYLPPKTNQNVRTRNKPIVLAGGQNYGLTLQYAGEFQNDKELVLMAVQQDGLELQFASPELRRDKDIVLAAVQHNGQALRFAGPELRNTKEIILAAVQQDGSALRYASPELRNTKPIVMTAVVQHGLTLEYASKELQNDKDIVLTAIQQHGCALQYASDSLKNDKDIVLAAVIQNGLALQHVNEELKMDKDIVLAAVEQRGQALGFASEELQNDKEIVLTAVKQSGGALEYASEELQKDKEIVLAAVQQHGRALQFASKKLKKNKEIVIAAVQGTAVALQFASPSLREDPAFVYTLMKHNGLALQFVDPLLQNDKEIVYAAILQNRSAFKYASEILRKDPNFVTTANQHWHQHSNLELVQDLDSKSPVPEWTDTESSAPSDLSNPSSRSVAPLRVENSNLQAQINAQADQIQNLEDQVAHLQKIYHQLHQQFPTFFKPLDSKELTEIPKVKTSPSTTLAPPNSHVDSVILEDLDRDEQKEYQAIQQSKTLYNAYIKEHQSELQPLDWIALYNNDYSTVQVFKNQDQAFEYCRGHRPKFYKQYYGPDVYGERIYRAIETAFGRQNQGQHPRYAYAEGRISDPEDEKNYRDVTFMMDTGATVCLGRRDILKLDLKLTMHDGDLIDGLGKEGIPTIYVETKISLKGLDGTYLPPRLALIGYEVKKSPPPKAEDWLLGQNYLGLCKHTWTGLTKVELEPLI